MRHPLPLLAITAMLFIAPSLPAQAAPNEMHLCPGEARGVVSHDGDASWVATNQTSHLIDARVERVGREVALACVYRMFGGEYWIYKRPSAEYPNCRRSDGGGRIGFYCTH